MESRPTQIYLQRNFCLQKFRYLFKPFSWHYLLSNKNSSTIFKSLTTLKNAISLIWIITLLSEPTISNPNNSSDSENESDYSDYLGMYVLIYIKYSYFLYKNLLNIKPNIKNNK